MQDIFGAIHHLKRGNRYQVPYLRVKSHKSSLDDSTVNYALSGGSNNFFLGGNPSIDVKFRDTQDVWVQLVYGITSPVLAELSSLGLLNPAEIVWEVTKYSFVVDWFLPIGHWLSALTADVGFNFITGCQSSRASREVLSVTSRGAWPESYDSGFSVRYNRWPSLPTYSGKYQLFRRTCYADSPVPGLYVKNPLSYDHVANALSLLVQAFTRR